ncbi:MAG: DUF1292 domain-containing protein [Firmicutes bacterium]|nr:DUF1292 domain-containing protein [Bacillota bacterium]
MDEKLHESGCDCGCEEETSKMTLVLDDDSELTCDVLGMFDVEDAEYIALLPEDDDEVLIYRYIDGADNEEGFELVNIESDEEYEKVSDIFFDLFYDDEEMDDELEQELEE